MTTDDRLPVEYPWREAVAIYAERLGYVALAAVVPLLALLVAVVLTELRLQPAPGPDGASWAVLAAAALGVLTGVLLSRFRRRQRQEHAELTTKIVAKIAAVRRESEALRRATDDLEAELRRREAAGRRAAEAGDQEARTTGAGPHPPPREQ